MTRKQTGWNMQPNTKNKPNAQGTLFSGGKEQMNPARYPRGYTPQRQAAVNQSLRYVHDYATPESEAPRYSAALGPYARRAKEQIKQSSIPPEHLKNLSINVVDPEDQYSVEHGLGDGVDGEYHAMGHRWVQHTTGTGDQMSLSRRRVATGGDINISHEAGPETLLHEVGHHVSATAGTPHAAYDSPYQRGREEGFADRYADTHRTPRLGFLPERGKANYPPSDWQADGRASEFHAGYDNMRPYDERPMNAMDLWDARHDTRAKDRKDRPHLPGLGDFAMGIHR